MSELSYSDKDGICFLLQVDPLTRNVYLTFCGKKRLYGRVPANTEPSQWTTKLARKLIEEIRRIKRKAGDEEDIIDVCFPDNYPFGD